MRSFQFLPVILAVALSSPTPQDLNLKVIDDELPDPTTVAAIAQPAPTIISYDPSAALASVIAQANSGVVKRAKHILKGQVDNSGCNLCEVQPSTQNRYDVNLDTPESFLTDPTIANVANNAASPAGYTNTFTNLQAASNGYVYMGYDVLDSVNAYNPSTCAAKCNSIAGCAAFNIYFERAPTVDPCSSTCQNPPAYANIKCSYWGGPLDATSAQNAGQWRNAFHVVIAGSNGYRSTTIPTPNGYSPTQYLGSASINAPLNCLGTDTYMGYKLFENTPFDIRLCAAACSAQTAYNLAHPPQNGPVRTCNFWNTYLLNKNGIAQGQTCALYTEKWDASYATNVGQWRGQDHYTISASYAGYNTSYTPACSDTTN